MASTLSESWMAETLRLTMFGASPISIEAASRWWEATTGAPPERTRAQPRASMRVDEGPYGDWWLVLTANPARIDWLLVSHPDRQGESDGPAVIGPLAQLVGAFTALIHRWVDAGDYPTAQRVAFGATVSCPPTSVEKATGQLAQYLPSVNLDPKTMRDFLFQVNRPRVTTTGIAGLSVNRLAKWGVLGIQTAILSIGPGSVQQQTSLVGFAPRLELDLSTSQEYKGQFKAAELHVLIDELVSLALEIAKEGDVA